MQDETASHTAAFLPHRLYYSLSAAFRQQVIARFVLTDNAAQGQLVPAPLFCALTWTPPEGLTANPPGADVSRGKKKETVPLWNHPGASRHPSTEGN